MDSLKVIFTRVAWNRKGAYLQLDAGAGFPVGARRVEFLDDLGLEGVGHIVGGRGGGHSGQQHHDGARAQSHCVLLRLGGGRCLFIRCEGPARNSPPQNQIGRKKLAGARGEAVRPVGIKAPDGCRLSYT
jgi:hypothetical protein